MDPILTNLGPILTLAGVVVAAFLTYRASTRQLHTNTGLQLLNEHQEEIAALRLEVAALRRTQRLQGDYIGQLRQHIADGSPPPPPSWPPGLTS